MNFEQLINARQSDRKYDTQPIDRALLVRCLEAARIAPSACNSQPWKFVVVDDPKLLAGMKEAAAGSPQAARSSRTSCQLFRASRKLM